jgi:hypothetical protein
VIGVMNLAKILLWLGALSAAGAVVAAERAPDFRQSSWGMTPAEVRKSETRAEALESPSPSELWYQDSLVGRYPVRILYQFAQGKLVRGAYLLTGGRQPADYDFLQGILSDKYGAPVDASGLNPFGERETTWRAGLTEINLLEDRDSPGERSGGADRREDGRTGTSLEINYYSVEGATRDAALYRKETAENRATDAVIHDVIESWRQVAPGVWEWNEL